MHNNANRIASFVKFLVHSDVVSEIAKQHLCKVVLYLSNCNSECVLFHQPPVLLCRAFCKDWNLCKRLYTTKWVNMSKKTDIIVILSSWCLHSLIGVNWVTTKINKRNASSQYHHHLHCHTLLTTFTLSPILSICSTQSSVASPFLSY